MESRTRDPNRPPAAPSPLRRAGRAWTGVRRALLRRRRLLAAVLAAIAAVAIVRAVAPPAPARAQVTVAARDLPAGAVLTAKDLAHAAVPPDAVPASMARAPVGRTLAAPLTRGEPITEPRLVGAHLTDAAPGTTSLAVRISDPQQAGLLTVGDRIDLLATDPEHATTSVVARDVAVLAVPAASSDATGDGGGGLTGRLVILAVPIVDVEHITAASVTAFVTYAWSNG